MLMFLYIALWQRADNSEGGFALTERPGITLSYCFNFQEKLQ